MKIRLFDIDKGKAKITPQVKEIYYLSAIIAKWGEEAALKLFQVFDKVYDPNPDTNPYANLPEDSRYETIIRSMHPELEALVDLNHELIEQALDLVGELYETPKYRAYKSLKTLHDRLVKQIEHSNVILTKEGGNMGEINKALKSFEDLDLKMSKAYKELEAEMNVKQTKGGVKARRKTQQELG